MINSSIQNIKSNDLKNNTSLNYNEVILYLDAHWSTPVDKTLKRMRNIDKIIGQPAKQLATILIAGSNGKSITAHFTAKLLKEEGINAGILNTAHLLTYNERIVINDELISNLKFTELANQVITALEQEKITANSSEILTAMALLAFEESKQDVAILEVAANDKYDPVTICNTKVVAITRVTSDQINHEDPKFIELVKNLADLATKNSVVISADQSKINLEIIQAKALENGAQWAMPIRKLAALPYPFEQLHGRCAALAERAAQIYIENFNHKNSNLVASSLLVKPKGQRGRPSLEAKRSLELNPRRTVEQFWQEYNRAVMPGRFELLAKEMPNVLLDTADNLDAMTNTLLGIRLIHYKKPIKGLIIIIGCENDTIHTTEFLKQIRYFFKKTSGQIIFCPIKKQAQAEDEIAKGKAWNVDAITNDMKNVKVKAQASKSFSDAFELAKKTVDDRHGLIVVTGSKSIVTEYWQYKNHKRA